MRLFALVTLCVMVAVHHGVPMLGHQGHAAAPQAVAAGGHESHGVPGPSDDHGAAIGACLAVLMAAGLAGAALGARRRWVLRRAVSRPWPPTSFTAIGPPAHGPPGPTRPCVLQR